jgi:tRNA pseudouridine32 synthase/23S rRNA pseudouridine746 synthase
VPQGSTLHLYYDEGVLMQQPDEAKLIADEGQYSVWYKPYGMLSQGSKWGDHCTVYRWAEQNLSPQRPAFIIHRLDRAASGLVLIAHSKKVAAYFSRQFRDRKVEKVYQARVEGELPEAMTIDSKLDTKEAISHVLPKSFDAVKNQSLVEICIETGRKHQIRRHLAGAGYPIAGDRLYGNASREDTENLALAACLLAFDGPGDESRRIYELDRKYCPALLA